MVHIIVSGVSGVGKTTWGTALASHSGALFASEHLSDNEFVHASVDRNELGLRFLSQCAFLLAAGNQHYRASSAPLPTVQDHSIYEVMQIYTQQYADKGILSTGEYSAVESMFRALCALCPPPSAVLFLRADPEIVRHRRALRSQPSDLWADSDAIRLEQAQREAIWKLMDLRVVDLDTSERTIPNATDPFMDQLWGALTK